MAFKLTKHEATQKQEYHEALQTAEEALTTAIEHYNACVTDVNEWVENIASERRAEYEDRSERWQDGANGQAAEAWVAAWEEFDAEPVEIPDSVADALETLPDEPEG